MPERISTVLSGTFGPQNGEFTFDVPIEKPGKQEMTLEQLRNQIIEEECRNLTGKPCPTEEAVPTIPLPKPKPTETVVYVAPKMSTAIDPDQLVPDNEYFGTIVGTVLAASALGAYANRKKFTGVARRINDVKDEVKNTALEYALDVAFEPTLKYLRDELEKDRHYSDLKISWDGQDIAALREARHATHNGPALVHMVYRTIASLADINEKVQPKDVLRMLGEEFDHMSVDRSQRWHIRQRSGNYYLVVAMKEYSLATFARHIRTQIANSDDSLRERLASVEPVISG